MVEFEHAQNIYINQIKLSFKLEVCIFNLSVIFIVVLKINIIN